MVKVIFTLPHEHEDLNDMMVVDMHCHTTISDGLNTPNEIIARAKKLNIGISITDHNEIDATIKACKSMLAIPGIEATSSDAVDFLLYFYSYGDLEDFYHKIVKHRHLKSRGFDLKKLNLTTEELLDAARLYNCVISLPHPLTIRPKNSYNYMKKHPRMLKYVDAIEGINSVMHIGSNEKSTDWAKKLKKGITGGSDAHMIKHLGRAVTASYADNVEEFLNNILKKNNIVVGRSLDLLSKLHAKTLIFKRNLTW